MRILIVVAAGCLLLNCITPGGIESASCADPEGVSSSRPWSRDTEDLVRALAAGMAESRSKSSTYTAHVIRTIHEIDEEIGDQYWRHDVRVRYDNGKLWNQYLNSADEIITVYRDDSVYVNYGGGAHGQIDIMDYDHAEDGNIEECWDVRVLGLGGPPKAWHNTESDFVPDDDAFNDLSSLVVSEENYNGVEAWCIRGTGEKGSPEDWSETWIAKNSFRPLELRGHYADLYDYTIENKYSKGSTSGIPDLVVLKELYPDGAVKSHITYEVVSFEWDADIPDDTFTLASIRPVGITPVNDLRSMTRLGYWDNGEIVDEPPNARRVNRQQSLADTPAVAGREPDSTAWVWWTMGAVVLGGVLFIFGRRSA